ncbi:MAG TPA: DNA/RNA non-specific endonuclease [Thermoanaerobaculia bacterium]|nr:DNA/RNA non-specific endonuclease [Thermoanaerobaculia bacterium]
MAQAASPNVVISQVYGGGGNAGATYRNDFIELFNRGTATVSLAGWSVQYASSTGTSWQVTPLTGSIAPGQYYLVQQAQGTGGTVSLPAPNATGTIAMSATAGKIALVASTAALTGGCPSVVDFVGFGGANCFEGAATPALSNTTAALRKGDGCTDTDSNSGDFTVGAPAPRNSASPANSCGVTDAAPSINAPANPAAVVFVDAAPFSVNLTGNDDGGVYVWSATAGTGVAAVAVTGGQGTASATYGVTLQAGFTGTATFTASLSDNVNPAATRTVNIQVNPNVVNLAPQIFAPANPIATVAQDAAPFAVNLFGADDNGVFTWSASAGAGVSAVAVSAGQGTGSATFTVTLQAGFSGTATFTASLTDTFNAAVSQAVHVSVTPAPAPPPDHLVISQVYGGGGNSGAALRNDYVELYNPTNSTIDTSGWTIQYGAATNTVWAATPLGGVIQPGEYYLVQLASGGTNGALLPVEPNVTGDLNLSGTAGKVALVRGGDPLSGCVMSNPLLVDLVGFGTTANCREGSGNAPAPSNTNAIFRKNGGFTDTNVNSADFVTGTPGPRRTAVITEPGPNVLNVDPRNANTTAPRDASLTVTFSESVDVSGAWFAITCASSGLHHDATVAGSGRTWIITPNANFVPGESCTATVFKDFVHDTDLDDSAPNSDTLPANYVWSFSIATGTAPAYTPDVHLTMGNPSDAVTDVNAPNNYLMEKPELTLSYNRDRGTPNWVSWHLADEWVGSLARVDTFRPDPQVPAEWYRVTHIDYSGSGFDRGHMVPNADRDPETSMPINQATFLMSNMLPQTPDNNQGPWAEQENYLRTLLPQNELYIVAGGAGTGGTGSNGFTNTIANGRVTVPAVTWKVVLVIPKGSDDVNRVTAGARTIAVVMPNVQGIRNNDWQNYLTTVDAVEALTGYDFFENVADAVENAIEAGTNGVNPPGLDHQSFSTNEDEAKSFTFEAASPGNGTLTYTIVTPPSHGTLSGSGASQTYTPAPDFNGSDSFTFRASNGSLTSNVATMTVTVFEKNDAPVAADDALSTNEDAALQFGAGSLTNNDHAGANESQSLTVASVSATANTHGTVSLAGGVVTYTPAPNYHGAASFTYSVCDNGVTRGAADSLCATATVHVNVIAVNDAPAVSIAVASSATEGSAVAATAAASDADGDSLSYAWTVTKNGAPFASTPGFTPDDNGTYVVSVVVSDGSSSATDAKTVTVSNVAPVIAATAGPAASLSLGTAATVSVSFSDAGAADTHSATFTWGDGTTSTAACAAGVCSATRTYTAAGIYTVGILLADDDGATAASAFQSAIVTDANAGSVTGGGWIDTQAGKGTLAVSAKYQKDGSINGNVKFDVAGSGFTASTYEWLVVSGTTATVKGTGTVDGVAGYAYLVTVNDANPDTFGIRIWNPATNAVLFDTTTPQPLGGGSLTIHTK